MNKTLYMLVEDNEKGMAFTCYLDKDAPLGSIIELEEIMGRFTVVSKDKKLKEEFENSPEYTISIIL